MYTLINLIIIRTRAIYRIHGKHRSLFDEDAVYLIESVVGGLHICKRARSPTVCEGTIPYCLRGPSTVYTRRQKR